MQQKMKGPAGGRISCRAGCQSSEKQKAVADYTATLPLVHLDDTGLGGVQ